MPGSNEAVSGMALLQSGFTPESYTGPQAFTGGTSFSALTGLSQGSAPTPSQTQRLSSGESYDVDDRFTLPGPTWAQQFCILLWRIMRTRRGAVLDIPDASLVLGNALISGKICFLLSYCLNIHLDCSLKSGIHADGMLKGNSRPDKTWWGYPLPALQLTV